VLLRLGDPAEDLVGSGFGVGDPLLDEAGAQEAGDHLGGGAAADARGGDGQDAASPAGHRRRRR